ncbi:diguanylate cyclase [Motilimonas eburnea]|uniref:diguanylate cyclase n=1 Tax=Motilimonas eburnea TaxID=1737488 RepID=UPI001E41A658|nr:diguanylate cyclase [Motilimonas eburnea]
MNQVISRRLLIITLLSVGLILVMMVSLFRLHSHQVAANVELAHIMKIQLNLDLLRSHIWQYHQYDDDIALVQAQETQMMLSELLNNSTILPSSSLTEIVNLQRMNITMGTLLKMQISEPMPDSFGETEQSSMLQARLNMTIQGMAEDLYRLHQRSIEEAQHISLNILYFNGVLLLVIAAVLALFAYATLRRFRVGFTMLHYGMRDLAKGELTSRLRPGPRDEFTQLAEFFNQMKDSLQKSTIKRDLLQYEVEQQTSQLRAQHIKLQYLAEHDELTGLFNRRAFSNQVTIAMARSKRTHSHAALLFIDLDFFKEINDNHGHDAGDFVLKTVAEKLKALVRESDLIGRLGGDEFVVWLDLLGESKEAEKKTKQISSTLSEAIGWHDKTLAMGASIGMAMYPEQGKTFSELLKLADHGMYEDKKRRRDNASSSLQTTH